MTSTREGELKVEKKKKNEIHFKVRGEGIQLNKG